MNLKWKQSAYRANMVFHSNIKLLECKYGARDGWIHLGFCRVLYEKMRGLCGWEGLMGVFTMTDLTRKRLNTRGGWRGKSVGTNGKEIWTELKNCYRGLNKCPEGEAAGEDSRYVGLQGTASFWGWRGSDYNLEVEWRKKRPLEMKRSRKLRSQGAGMGIHVVNLTEVDWAVWKGRWRSRDCSPQWTRTCDLVVESGRRTS